MTQAQTFDALAFVKAKRAAEATGFDALEFVRRKRAEERAIPAQAPAPNQTRTPREWSTSYAAFGGTQPAPSGSGLMDYGNPRAFADPQIDPNNYGPEIEQAAKSITPQEIADLRAYAKASGGNLDGQQDSDVALVAARMKLQPSGVMQRRGPSVSPVQDGGVAATSPLGQMARAIPGVKQARDFAYGAAQGGISQPGSGISSVLGTASGLAGFDNAAALFHEAANQINAQAPQGTGAAFKLGTVAGQVAPAVSAAATGGATSTLVMGLLSTASFGSGVQEYRNALLSRGEKPTPGGELAVGLAFAGVEWITEKVGLDAAMRKIPGLADSFRAFRTSPTPAMAMKLVDELAPVMLSNAGEEMSAQGGQNLIAKLKYDPNRDLTAGMGEAGLLGAAGGAMIALPGAGLNAIGAGIDAYDARRRAQNPQQPASRPQSHAEAQAAPTDTTLDDAAALAEQRLNERYNPAPTSAAAPSGFTTEKGSTYVFHEDGTTTRNKAARPDHPGEAGPQPRSARTWFIRPEDISKLDMVQATTAYPVTIDQYEDGRIGVRALGGPDAGKFYRGSMVTPQKAPAVGLIPVESWGNKHTVHFGNPIVSVANPAPVGQPSPADQSASSPTEQGNGDAEYEAAIQAIMAQRAERKAARQDTALQDEAVANIMERRNAARAERAAQATARTAQPPMRRVDRPTAPRVTLDPNAQVPTAPEPRRFTDRLTVPQISGTTPANPSTPTSARPANGSMEEARTATGTEPGAGTSPSPVLPGVQPPASSGQAVETGGGAGVGTSASPKSTREPWTLTPSGFRDWSYTDDYRQSRKKAEESEKEAENAVLALEKEVGVLSQSPLKGMTGVDGISPGAFGAAQAAMAIRQQAEFDAALEAMPEEFKKRHRDAVTKWEQAHAWTRAHEDSDTAREMAKEQGWNKKPEPPSTAQTENDDAIDPAEIAAEVARMKAMDPDTIPQENADGTGTGSTGGVGAARVNRQGAREGQQAEDAGDATEDARRLRGAQGSQGQVTGASESQIRAAKFKAAEDRKQQRKKDATAKGQATKAKYASNPPQFRASDIVKRLIDRAQNYPDLILDEMVQWGEDGALIPISDISTTFVGKLPTELTHEFDAEPQIRSMLRVVPTAGSIVGGNGADWLSKLGVQKYADVLRAKFYSGEGKSRMGVDGALAKLKDFTGQDHGAKFLVWLHDQFKDVGANRPDWTVAKASTLKDGDQFTINGINFEVMPDADENMNVRERGENFEAIDSGAYFFRDALDEIPIDAGTLKQADNTGEVPDIEPEQATTEGDDADAMLGRIKEQLDRGSGRQSADMIRAFQELGSTLVPGVRLQDAEEVGRMYAMLDDGTVTLAEYTNYIDDLRNSGKVAKPEPVAPAPEQAPEKPKFSDSEGVFGQKTESITGSQTSMFGNIAPDVTPDATRYPGIRSGETVAEYEKRMGTTDTPDMFGGPSSTGGDPRSPNYRPDLNDRISDALGRWSAAARSRFDDYMGKMQRGEILGSGPPITPMLDLAAHIAFKALQSGITSKSGRKLTAFIEGRMADIRAKWPQLNVTTDTLRRQVRNMLAAADDDKTKIIPAYAAARERIEKARTKQAGKTLGDPRAVREAVASATAERPDVAAKIIDVVKKGIRQGKEAGILTATAQIQPLIDRAKRATQASRRAREMGKIEARGAVESVKAEAEARAEERRGIRAEAVRLVQDTPIAGRGKYLSAVANAKTMKDLSKVLGRLRRDLAKSVGNQFAKVAAQLKKQERTLNEDRRLEATKAWAAVAANLDTIKNHKATTEELEQAAQNIREAAEALRSIFHSQKNADKVSILGRAITAQEHRDEMVKRLEMRKQLPQSDTPGQPRDKAWLRQKFDKFLNFHSMMMALDQEFYGNGPFARAWRAMSERRTAELAKNQEFADRADKIARKYGYKGLAEFIAKSSGALGDASQQWIDVELGDFKRITLGQALDIYARDAETREKMHKRQRFTFDPEGGSGSFIINDAKIAQIENALTKQQKQLAREMNRLRSEMQFDRMNETYKTLTGNYLVQVPEHYPIRRAMKLSESPDITKGLGEWTIKKMEEAGYLKQRVGGSAPIVIGDFATTQLRQFQMAEAFIQRGTIVKYLGATLLHPDVRVPIVQRHGTKIMDRVQQTISEFSGNESPQQDRMLRKLMSNVARAQTQVNIGTWARNMATAFNVPLAIVDGKMIGVRKTLRGILKALASPRKTMQILMRHSPDLRHRWSHAGASISLMHGTDVQASTDIADTAFSDAAKGTIRQILSAIKGIGAGKFLSRTADVSRPWNQLLDAIKLGNVFDGFGAMVAYHAVRADAPASLSPNAADKWAARRAAGIFAQTANTNDLLNSNEWQVDARRSTWTAGILAFTSDIAKKQNLLYLATKRGKKATAYATAAVTLGALWSTAITAAISAAVGDDEDKIKKRAAEGMAKELVSLMPAGTLTSNVLEMVMNPRGSSGILDTPLTAVSKNVLAAVKKFADAADDGEEADVFEGAYRVLRVLNDVTGAPIGPTAGMVKRAIVNYGTE